MMSVIRETFLKIQGFYYLFVFDELTFIEIGLDKTNTPFRYLATAIIEYTPLATLTALY